jgi:hypothetical protein
VCAARVHSMGIILRSDALPVLRRFSAAPTGVFRPPSRSLVCRGRPNPPRVPCCHSRTRARSCGLSSHHICLCVCNAWALLIVYHLPQA